jgi:hypothetical protein
MRACWALLTIGDDGEIEVEYRREAYDAAAEAAAIRLAGLPNAFAEALETGGAQAPAGRA